LKENLCKIEWSISQHCNVVHVDYLTQFTAVKMFES